MNKCTKCGTEFEGKFCPECGTAVSGKPGCPRCGSELNEGVKFCPNCGYNLIEQQPQADTPQSNVAMIVFDWRRLLQYLPIVFFGLWAVLLWAFFASTVVDGDGFFVDKVNLYQMFKDSMMSDMYSAGHALVAFAAISNAYLILLVLAYWKGSRRTRKIFTYAGFALHIAVIICASVLSSQCKTFTENGFEEMYGNLPAVVISLTAVFAFLQIVAMLLDKFFGNNDDSTQIIATKKERKPIQVPKFIVSTGKWIRSHKGLTGVLSVTIVAVIVLCTVLPITFGNIFRIGKVNQISLGDTHEQVEAILGKPYAHTSNDRQYNYYSKNATKILDKIYELSEQQDSITNFDKLDKLIAQMEKLEEQLKLLDCKQITVNFAENKVASLKLDTHVGKFDEKKISKIYLGAQSGLINKNYTVDLMDIANGEIEEHIEFTDGSYSLREVSDITVSGVSFATTDRYSKSKYPTSAKLYWTNQYGEQSQTVQLDSSNIDFAYSVSNGQLKLSGTILSRSFYELFGMNLPWEDSNSRYDKITSIYFDKSVNFIPDIAELLTNTSILKEIVVDSDNPFYFSQEGILFNKDKSELLYIPPENESLLSTDWYNAQPQGLIYVGNTLWTYKGTMPQNYKLVIKEGTKKIAAEAFINQINLIDVFIPSSVTSIGARAFYGCSIEYATIPTTAIGIIPQSHLKKVVINGGTSIDEDAFRGCSSLTDITIPSSVTSIGSGAFSSCSNLTSITIPSSVTSIRSNAFAGCSSLMSITIPSNVTWIGDETFYGCSSLTSITIPSGVTSIGSSAFEDCSNLTSITIPSSATSIGGGAFSGCSGLQNVIFEDDSKLQHIGLEAFNGCSSLSEITIPSSVISIGYDAFSGCSSLDKVYYYGTLPDWCKISFGGYHNHYSSNPMSPASHFYTQQDGNWQEVTEIVIPDSVTEIGDYQFCSFNNVTSITIPSTVTSIGEYAFGWCSNLQTVVFADDSQLQSIGEMAFWYCSNLASVTIPSSVTRIGEETFAYCSSLTSIKIPSSVTSIGRYAFFGCSSLTIIYCEVATKPSGWSSYWNSSRPVVWSCLSNDVASDGYIYIIVDDIRYALKDNVAMVARNAYSGDLVIPASVEYKGNQYPVTSINEGAFEDCSSLTSITIPSGVTSIGEYAFYGCSSLQNVIFEDDSQLQIIGDDAFRNCISLTSITIPSSVTSIGEYAFYDCSSLQNVIFEDDSQLQSIDSAFYGCSNLTSIVIPSSVTSIGDYAFYGCDNLQTVYYGGNEEQWTQIQIWSYSDFYLTFVDLYYYSADKPDGSEWHISSYWHWDETKTHPVIWH